MKCTIALYCPKQKRPKPRSNSLLRLYRAEVGLRPVRRGTTLSDNGILGDHLCQIGEDDLAIFYTAELPVLTFQTRQEKNPVQEIWIWETNVLHFLQNCRTFWEVQNRIREVNSCVMSSFLIRVPFLAWICQSILDGLLRAFSIELSCAHLNNHIQIDFYILLSEGKRKLFLGVLMPNTFLSEAFYPSIGPMINAMMASCYLFCTFLILFLN